MKVQRTVKYTALVATWLLVLCTLLRDQSKAIVKMCISIKKKLYVLINHIYVRMNEKCDSFVIPLYIFAYDKSIIFETVGT